MIFALFMNRWMALILGLLYCVVLPSPSLFLLNPAQAQTQGLHVQAKTRDGSYQNMRLYSGAYALVIGCSEYRNGWRPLANAVKDAREIAQALKGLGWAVDILTNPDGQQMREAFHRLIMGPGQDPEKGILIWYSGHGETIEEDGGTKMGYLVPVDAPLVEASEAGFRGIAVDMRQLEATANRIRSKHVLMAFDSCFSSAVSVSRGASFELVEEKITMPVRLLLTAGREDEEIPERSVFKTSFLEGIQSKYADRNKDGYVTGEELGSCLQERIVKVTRRGQHPQFGRIRSAGVDRGDFVFILPGLLHASATKSGTHEETEVTHGEPVSAKQESEAPGQQTAPPPPSRSAHQATGRDNLSSVDESVGHDSGPGKYAVLEPSLSERPVPNRRKLLILPWDLKLNAHQHSGMLSDGLTDGIMRSGSFDYVISYYDPKSWPTSAALSSTAPEFSLNRLWPDRASGGGLNVQEICRIGRMFGVGVAVTGAWRVPATPVNIDSESIELYLIDIQSGQVFSHKAYEKVSIYHGDFKPYLIGMVKKVVNSYVSQVK